MPISNDSPRGKRILMLVENSSYESDERVRHEAGTLVAAGYQVMVIAQSQNGQPWHEIVDGLHIYRFRDSAELFSVANGLLGYAWEYGYSMVAIFLLSLVVFFRHGFDILHIAHPPDTFVFIAAFYKLLGKRYVLDHHDLAPELYFYARFHGQGNRQIHGLLLWLESLSFRLADLVISTNESYRQIALQRGRVDPGRVFVVRNGPDTTELRSSLLEESLCQPGRVLIGYVGVMGVQDGVDNLLRALQHLVNDLQRTDFLCVIVGAGSALPGLKQLTRELQLEAHVLFTGWVDGHAAVARYLNTMDLCVAPEPSDAYNDRSTAAKVMEYMALGKPVVSFELPEHAFTARDAALYARPGDELDFARQILRLMDDPALRAELGRRGLARIENELAWVHQGRNLVAGYARLTGERGPK